MRLEIHWLEEVDSTNLQAQRMLERGCPEGTVVVARRQTAGRGRLGRDWRSPAGGLYLTAVLRPSLRGEELGWISVAGGLAAAEELADSLEGKAVPLLKWPNDVLLGGRKVGGILGESRGGSQATAVLVGIGLNLTTDPAELPERPVFPASTVLAETGVALEPEALGRAVAERLCEWYERLQREGPGALRRRLMQLTAHAGKPIEVQDGETILRGRDAGISETGALRLDTGAEVIELPSGQIVKIHVDPREAK